MRAHLRPWAGAGRNPARQVNTAPGRGQARGPFLARLRSQRPARVKVAQTVWLGRQARESAEIDSAGRRLAGRLAPPHREHEQPMTWLRRYWVALLAGIVGLGVGAAAGALGLSGNAKPQTLTLTTATITATATKGAPAPTMATSSTQAAASSNSPASGSSLTVHDLNGNTLAVSVTGPIDPATAASPDLQPAAGTRFVALQLRLTNKGAGTISSDANVNLTVLGSDGQAYTPSFAPITECTNFSHGDYALLGGDSERGCVVFQLPDGVKVRSAQFSLGNGTVQFNGH